MKEKLRDLFLQNSVLEVGYFCSRGHRICHMAICRICFAYMAFSRVSHSLEQSKNSPVEQYGLAVRYCFKLIQGGNDFYTLWSTDKTLSPCIQGSLVILQFETLASFYCARKLKANMSRVECRMSVDECTYVTIKG